MGDRELLELAAGVAGLRDFEWGIVEEGKVLAPNSEAYHRDNYGIRWRWNPLEDDGDALRLTVKLGLKIDIDLAEGCTRILNEFDGVLLRHMHFDGGAEDATRRAIVRAAAEIGKLTPSAPSTDGGGK